VVLFSMSSVIFRNGLTHDRPDIVSHRVKRPTFDHRQLVTRVSSNIAAPLVTNGYPPLSQACFPVDGSTRNAIPARD
jgi:hypothetical protein